MCIEIKNDKKAIKLSKIKTDCVVVVCKATSFITFYFKICNKLQTTEKKLSRAFPIFDNLDSKLIQY